MPRPDPSTPRTLYNQQPAPRSTDRDGRRNSKDQNRPVRVTAIRRLSLRARRSDASTRSGRTSTCTGLTIGAPRRVRMKAWRCGPLVSKANSIRQTRSDQKRGHEGQRPRRNQNSLLDPGGLLMKAVNAKVAFKRTTAARSRGRSPRRRGTAHLRADAGGVRPLQRLVGQQSVAHRWRAQMMTFPLPGRSMNQMIGAANTQAHARHSTVKSTAGALSLADPRSTDEQSQNGQAQSKQHRCIEEPTLKAGSMRSMVKAKLGMGAAESQAVAQGHPGPAQQDSPATGTQNTDPLTFMVRSPAQRYRRSPAGRSPQQVQRPGWAAPSPESEPSGRNSGRYGAPGTTSGGGDSTGCGGFGGLASPRASATAT